MVLLVVLMGGMFAPAAACALICERHPASHAAVTCCENGRASRMTAMAHDHAAMNPAMTSVVLNSAENASRGLRSQSCQQDCVAAGHRAISKSFALQLRSTQNPAMPAIAIEFWTPEQRASKRMSHGPTDRFPSGAAFSILRI